MTEKAQIKKDLQEITIANCSKEEKLIRLLHAGCDHYGLILGLISEIKDGAYIVKTSYPDGLVSAGEEFDLGETICDVTYQSEGVTFFPKASGTPWVTHPAYDKFAIESYIGTTYTSNGTMVGTINFSCPTARGKEFTPDDIATMGLFSQTLTEIINT